MFKISYKYPRREYAGLILSASILPLYLSMFRYSFFGATIRLADLLLFALVLINLVNRPKIFYNFFQVRLIPVWVFVVYLLINGLFHNDIEPSIKEAIQTLWVMVFFIISSFYAKKNSSLFLQLTVFFLFISVLYTVFFHLINGQYLGYKLAGDAKYAFGLLSLLSLFKATINKDKVALRFFLLTLIPLFLSLERKGIFGVSIALVVLSLFYLIKARPTKGEVKLIFISITVSVAFALYFFDFNSFISNEIYLANFLDEEVALYTSNIHRENLLLNSYQIIIEHPLLGVGADRITYYMYDYYWDERLINGAHNFYVDMLVHYGVIGLLILISWSLHQIYLCFKSKCFHKELYCFYIYSIFVITFMSTGQAVLLIFFMPFLNPYMFLNHD